jgi:prepilin-type N-terminal cleavage/methylation domain-containing protein
MTHPNITRFKVLTNYKDSKEKNMKNNKNGFTLIELIIVMVILGIMAAVAVPRYLDSIANAEESAEDAVISAIRSGLKQYANNSLYESGRATWPTNPFDALSEKPAGYSTDGMDANVDGEWTFSNGRITHQRADNSRWEWSYDPGTQGGGDEAKIGSLDQRKPLSSDSANDSPLP